MTNQNVFIVYTTPSNSCNQYGGTCGANETIAFTATTFTGYDFACANHTFSWTFGDRQAASDKSVTHKYTGSGTFTVGLTIFNGSQTFPTSASVVVGAGGNPTPTTPTPTGCAAIQTGLTFYASYTGPQSGCTQYTGDATPCSTAETIPFTAGAFNYDFSCATHAFSWDFGDSQTGSGKTANHRYVNAGAYNLKLTITVGGQAYPVNQTVKVGSSSGIQPEHVSYISAHGTGTSVNDRMATSSRPMRKGAQAAPPRRITGISEMGRPATVAEPLRRTFTPIRRRTPSRSRFRE